MYVSIDIDPETGKLAPDGLRANPEVVPMASKLELAAKKVAIGFLPPGYIDYTVDIFELWKLEVYDDYWTAIFAIEYQAYEASHGLHVLYECPSWDGKPYSIRKT